jgi:hypothetical protein
MLVIAWAEDKALLEGDLGAAAGGIRRQGTYPAFPPASPVASKAINSGVGAELAGIGVD